jgi:hypothetical protein
VQGPEFKPQYHQYIHIYVYITYNIHMYIYAYSFLVMRTFKINSSSYLEICNTLLSTEVTTLCNKSSDLHFLSRWNFDQCLLFPHPLPPRASGNHHYTLYSWVWLFNLIKLINFLSQGLAVLCAAQTHLELIIQPRLALNFAQYHHCTLGCPCLRNAKKYIPIVYKLSCVLF